MVKRFVEDFNLSVMKTTDKRLDFYDIGIAELVMLPSARLLGRKIRNTAFREKYDTNIVAIRRRLHHYRYNRYRFRRGCTCE